VFDFAIIAVLTAIVVPFTFFTGLFFLPVLFLFVGFLYRWATIATGSATWGMRLAAIELRAADGGRLRFARRPSCTRWAIPRRSRSFRCSSSPSS
jgi:hypothetical protein